MAVVLRKLIWAYLVERVELTYHRDPKLNAQSLADVSARVWAAVDIRLKGFDVLVDYHRCLYLWRLADSVLVFQQDPAHEAGDLHQEYGPSSRARRRRATR